MRFKNHTNQKDAAAQAKQRAEASACVHSFFDVRPVCTGYHVETDTEYRVQACRGCDTRRDVNLDTGETFREYIPNLPPENVYVEPTSERDVYSPRFNGIDAFNETEDTSEPSNLFDRRGGNHGIGD